jgi:hypothetical protein
MLNEPRERALEGALFDLSERWRRDIGEDCWTAKRFRRMINRSDSDYRGGVWTVRHLLYTPEQSGFKRLYAHPGFTVEDLVLDNAWSDIFDEHDRRAARRKLDRKSK